MHINRNDAQNNPDHHASSIKKLFNQVSPQYDLMNDLMSFGLHRHWKNIAVDLGLIRSHFNILDLASGTGDLALRIAPFLNENGSLTCVDPSERMINNGRDRLYNNGFLKKIHYCCAPAEKLPFQDNVFDRTFVGFGFRNFTNHFESLKEIHRTLVPGGMALILEFSNMHSPFFKKIYQQYASVIPKIGEKIAQKENHYQYLIDSIESHPHKSKVSELFNKAGFHQCTCDSLMGGLVAIHRGFK